MRSVFFFLLLLFSVPALAEEPNGTQVSLSAQADQLLQNDEVVVRFRIEAEGPKVEPLRIQVDRISRLVSDRLGRETGVFQATTGRRIVPVWQYDNSLHRQIRDGWRLVQSGQAISTHLGDVPKWVGSIEKNGAHLDSLTYRVSRRAAASARTRLRIRAIEKFRACAVSTAKALDASSFRILRLNTDSIAPRPIQPVMAMAKTTDHLVPVFKPGRSSIKVKVSGEILLPEKDYPVK